MAGNNIRDIGGGAEGEMRVPRIIDSLDDLERAVQVLATNTNTLEARLHPVLQPPTESGDDSGRPAHPVPIHERLVTLIERVQAINGVVLDVTSRLEI